MDKAELRKKVIESEKRQTGEYDSYRKNVDKIFVRKYSKAAVRSGYTYIPYQDYLKTKHWFQTRRRILKAWSYRCAVCDGNSALNVHHLTYENKGAEKDTDLIVLCRTCHQDLHKIADIPDLKLIEAYREEWREVNN